MARTRFIKPGFFMNEELAELPCEARLLFIGLWTIADRAGRLEDRPRKIKAAVFPYEDLDVDTLLGQLAGKRFLKRYRLKGLGYIEISNFVKHQKPHPKEPPSQVPEPEDENEEGDLEDGRRPAPEDDALSVEDSGLSPEKTGRSMEKPGCSIENNGPSHGNPGANHDIQGPLNGATRTGPEIERGARDLDRAGLEIEQTRQESDLAGLEIIRPSRALPALTKDRRIESREKKYSEGKGGPKGKGGPGHGIRPTPAAQRQPDVEAVFNYWRDRTGHPEAKLTREREMNIRGRLEEGYTVEQLQEAIEGCRGSPFHQGDNERGHRYDDITLICRSGSKVEQFAEMAREDRSETRQCGSRSNVRKIMQGIELVRSRAAQSRDTGDDNQQSQGRMLTASTGT